VISVTVSPAPRFYSATMEEILTNTDDPEVPLRDKEFYGLGLSDGDEIRGPGFFVRQLHASWSALQGTIAWDEFDIEKCVTYENAKRRYEARRAALVQKGYIYSDLEM
jgi:hypothetical protein